MNIKYGQRDTDTRWRLGIDTGGTFTDAVVIDRQAHKDRGEILGSAKARTTPDALEIGIADAVREAVAAASLSPDRIGLVSLSTTLATNALAEGRTHPTALVLLGLDRNALRRSVIHDFGDPSCTLFIRGGHDALGAEREPLDLETLEAEIRRLQGNMDAVAIVGMFAVRNSTHERQARSVVRRLCQLPATCSHELTAELDGPRRMLTTWLNAGLVPAIGILMSACEQVLSRAGIDAPIMVVRGDGSLMSIDTARAYPVQTILSGPAASVIGARYLTGCDHAIVSDIGGTTTDIAVLDGGEVRVDPRGARVHGRRIFVRAIDIRTFALGGDSEVGLVEDAPEPRLSLGPRRAVPITEYARRHPELVRETLKRQTDQDRSDPRHARFAEISRRGRMAAPGVRDRRMILAELVDGPLPVDELAGSQRRMQALNRLRTLDRVRISAFTPTDAFAVLQERGRIGVAARAAALLARQPDSRGRLRAAGDPQEPGPYWQLHSTMTDSRATRSPRAHWPRRQWTESRVWWSHEFGFVVPWSPSARQRKRIIRVSPRSWRRR